MINNTEQKNIPNGWQEKKLGDICDIVNGSTPSTSNQDYWSGDINWYTPNDLKYQKFVLDGSERKISEIGLKSIGSRVVPRHSLILSTRAPIGYLGITESKATFNQGCKGLTPKDNKLSERFLYYILFSQKKALNGLGSGSTFLELSSNNLASFEILIPPIKEQQKIAEILGTVDENIAKTQELIEATERLKRGLMQQLFTRGIGHTRFKETIFGNIPGGWGDLTMRDICTVRQGLQIPISERFKEPGDNRYVYLTIKYLRDAHLPDIAEYIENPSKGVICQQDDILMTRTGNTGKVITGVKGVFHNNFFLVDYNRDKISKEFLVYYLNSDLIQKLMKVRAGSTTIPDLNHGDFYSLPLALPQKKEQEKIAGILSAVDEKVSVNKKLKEKLTLLKKGLMRDLLSGEIRTNNH